MKRLVIEVPSHFAGYPEQPISVILRKSNTGWQAKDILFTCTIFKISPNVNGAIIIVALVALPFEYVYFSRLPAPVLDCIVSGVFHRDQPQRRPRSFHHVPPHAYFEVAVSPGMEALLVMC